MRTLGSIQIKPVGAENDITDFQLSSAKLIMEMGLRTGKFVVAQILTPTKMYSCVCPESKREKVIWFEIELEDCNEDGN